MPWGAWACYEIIRLLKLFVIELGSEFTIVSDLFLHETVVLFTHKGWLQLFDFPSWHQRLLTEDIFWRTWVMHMHCCKLFIPSEKIMTLLSLSRFHQRKILWSKCSTILASRPESWVCNYLNQNLAFGDYNYTLWKILWCLIGFTINLKWKLKECKINNLKCISIW